MKRIRRGSSRWRKAGGRRNSTEVVPSRFLRSTKRKLTEGDINNGITRSGKRFCRNESYLNDSSDCIIVDEIVSREVQDPGNKILTSTPVANSRSISEKFDGSCIKTTENINGENDSNDVIVISDSSRSILPSVVVIDDEKSDNEIQIIPSTSARENNQTNNGGKCLLDNVTKRTHGLLNCTFSKRNSSKGRRRRKKKDFRHKLLHYNNSLMNRGTSTLQPQIGRNIFVENSASIPKTGLRPVIIDGSNVAFHHSNNRFFSCKGLEICIKYFKIRGHEVVAFVPQYRLKTDKSDNPKLLDQLVREGDVVLTPSRIIDGHSVVSYDDRFIVQTAVVKGGVIVTRDNYRDLLGENPAWAETIKYRLLQFTWVKDILIFPNDPLGARGPTLEEFLKFN